MIAGLRGTLLSEDALERVVPDALRGRLGEESRHAARRRLHAWHAPLRSVLGPAAGARTLFDRLAVPLFSQLGYRVVPDGGPGATSRGARAVLEVKGHPTATLLVTGWGEDAARAWREAVLLGIAYGLRWCFALTGPSLRVVDGVRTYSRRFLEIDLETAVDNERTFAVFWGLLRASAMKPGADDRQSILERAIEISERQRAVVRSSLQAGVEAALAHLVQAFSTVAARRQRDQSIVLNDALIVIYRILFLLFAEARGLVPRWHPVYRDGYTIEALRQPIETLPRPRGLWDALQSIARLAHRGCRIGALQVTAFNGRLFSPAESPLADSVRLDDGAVRQALLALTTRPSPSGRERIAYGDLGVEQLGGVYERVLDLEKRRKTTGAFYTPRPLTEFVVRRTLAPLVQGASSERLLGLRVLDPAMGSGAFLVAACRYLAAAYESTLVEEQGLGADDIDDRDRAGFRRTIAQRCLYGVDINPMAVQLGRLSLWLATLAADRPLTFLDHRLRAGNSLVGAALADLAREPRADSHRFRTSPLPLFDEEAASGPLAAAIATRDAIAIEPGDTLAQVRAKERALARLDSSDASLTPWKTACDLWCSAWFNDRHRRERVPFSPLMDAAFGRGGLPDHLARPMLDEARAVATKERFFHWPLEFPEVFHMPGSGDNDSGFDAVIGNPPWEMLHGDGFSRLTAFARSSGIYSLQGDGHANLYQLFVERMLSLVRKGGRLGLIAPSGLATDRGAAPLRRALFERCAVDTLISFENRDGVFPIHRGLKFLVLAATSGGSTAVLPCRFGVRRLEILDELPETGPDAAAVPLHRALIERLSGEERALPDVRTQMDVELVAHVAFSVPALGSAEGWNVRFGRELNATDDRPHFHASESGRHGLPVIEGKHLAPFTVDLAATTQRISSRAAARLVDPARTFLRSRLAYRDVASPTNRLTLIAAIVPDGTITTHTLFCLKEPLDEDCQQYLCGMFNSFVANYLVRLRVGTHVTTAIINRLPVPKPARTSAPFVQIAELSKTLQVRSDAGAHARLQAHAARLYRLDRAQFGRVLDSFPLVPRVDRDAAMAAFCDIVT